MPQQASPASQLGSVQCNAASLSSAQGGEFRGGELAAGHVVSPKVVQLVDVQAAQESERWGVHGGARCARCEGSRPMRPAHATPKREAPSDPPVALVGHNVQLPFAPAPVRLQAAIGWADG